MSHSGIKVLLAAFAFSNLFRMASLQQRCPDSPSPDSGNVTTSIQCSDLKIIRPKATCPDPLDVMIEIPSLENHTANLALSPVVTIYYEGRSQQLDSEILTDTIFNGIFTLNITSDTNGLDATLSVKHRDEKSFDVRFQFRPTTSFGSKPFSFGRFRIDDSRLNFQSVCFINTTKETIVTMVTTNFNCTNQSKDNFSLPLILELSNMSQYNLQNRIRTCNHAVPRNDAPVALNVSINHACLNSTALETKLTLQNFSETFNMSSAILRAELSESTARPDVCKDITWNEDDEYCKATGTTTIPTTGTTTVLTTVLTTTAGTIGIVVGVIVLIIIIIVCIYKRRQNRSTNEGPAVPLQSQQSQTAENTNSDQVTGTEHSEAARHEGIRSTTADHQRSGTSN